MDKNNMDKLEEKIIEFATKCAQQGSQGSKTVNNLLDMQEIQELAQSIKLLVDSLHTLRCMPEKESK